MITGWPAITTTRVLVLASLKVRTFVRAVSLRSFAVYYILETQRRPIIAATVPKDIKII